MGIIETSADIERGVTALARIEPRFAAMVATTGLPPLRRRADRLAALLDIVVSQQLSKASAAAIWRRLEAGFAPFEASRLVRAGDGALRQAGLSRPKIRTIRALCSAVAGRELDLAALERASDEEVHRQLTAVSGIGPWTADIFLLSCLGRADAWPAGDLALQAAAAQAFGLDSRPDAAALAAMAEPWRPWRAVAARLLWAHYGAMRAQGAGPGGTAA